MTDSELLDKAQWTLQQLGGGICKKLARFVADYLDDSPVTEEALLKMGFKHDKDNIYRNGIYLIELYPDCCCVARKYQGYSADYIHGQVRTISQLRHLLRGLGVGV